jgi:phosphoglycerate-specific signal transduction histidine kinase
LQKTYKKSLKYFIERKGKRFDYKMQGVKNVTKGNTYEKKPYFGKEILKKI